MLDVTRNARVATLTIRRPQRRNAMDGSLVHALVTALRACDADANVGAIVLTGGEVGFCAGSDLSYIGGMPLDDMCRFEADTGDMARVIGLLSKPVIAAVERFAVGGGFILAVSCDLVVTETDARWHLPEVPIGWLTPWGLQALQARVGPVVARSLCWALAPIDGREAVRLGAADYVAKAGHAIDRAAAIALHLAGLPIHAVSAAKRFFAPQVLDHAEAMDAHANRLFADNCRHPVAQATLSRYGARA